MFAADTLPPTTAAPRSWATAEAADAHKHTIAMGVLPSIEVSLPPTTNAYSLTPNPWSTIPGPSTWEVRVPIPVRLRVNNIPRQQEVEPRVLLVHYLRDLLGLTGTHVGCETSICGACTVLLDGQAVKSCTMFAVQADGANITTIEGLAANGQLHPVQEGFWEHHGLQCGYCTPGMIIAATQIIDRNPNPSHDEIRHGFEGNLCGCTC